MNLIKTGLAAMGLGLAALIVYAIANGSFFTAGAWLTSQPWGLVTLADLYLGFVLTALVIWWFEPTPGKRLLWILPIPILGNVWTVIWFVLRLPHLRERLTRR